MCSRLHPHTRYVVLFYCHHVALCAMVCCCDAMGKKREQLFHCRRSWFLFFFLGFRRGRLAIFSVPYGDLGLSPHFSIQYWILLWNWLSSRLLLRVAYIRCNHRGGTCIPHLFIVALLCYQFSNTRDADCPRRVYFGVGVHMTNEGSRSDEMMPPTFTFYLLPTILILLLWFWNYSCAVIQNSCSCISGTD